MDDWLQQLFSSSYLGEAEDTSPWYQQYQWESPQGQGLDFDVYGYQGMSQDIMGALQNIFEIPEYYSGGGFFGFEPGGYYGPGGGGGGALAGLQLTPEGSTQDLLYGGGTALPFTDIFDPSSIADTLSQLGEFGYDEIKPGEVKALTPEMIEKTTSSYYTPYEESERASLVDKLSQAQGKIATGGFAGSGGRQAGLSGAERLYRGGYEDLLGDIMKMRGQATSDVMDTIYGWQELISPNS